jgi:hypothetical protein
VNAGSLFSREVYFAPHPERCPKEGIDCDPNRQFLEAAKAIAEAVHYQAVVATIQGSFSASSRNASGTVRRSPKTTDP